ncbi:nicotinate phosphoribosyltransferase [Mycoplasma todarodis]|uniref:nicotinate phosphoribosyltransferase n=1 Tax=Mycoplasma todarodis TaxID=1937191 RepID=A0A4R0XIL9_9MOLU|nr:nicotinate phosphoribosyltransferase [Mycoplasma todarodis]TCG10426.1 nicotinate phosphoribosyltransferase [Mycoplasma todarodis]
MNYKNDEKYIANYFFKTQAIINKNKPESIVTLQFFQRSDNVVLCGINEVLELLEKNTDTSKYKIKYLKEGSLINGKEVVLELEGKYSEFGIYEGMIDGILARQTSLATNSKRIKDLTNKKVIFMGDRADHYSNQIKDGHAINCGGIKTQVTQAQTESHGGQPVGTVPHALIQMFNGDLIKALKAYKNAFPDEGLVALVDFNNDVINDTLLALNEFGKDLKAVRVDTSDGVSDAYFKNDEEFGVTPNLIKALRKAMDENNGEHVEIIVSSGFNANKIKLFEDEKTPVDVYGVGGSLLKINLGFTADAVIIDGVKCAKFGRAYKENKELIKYTK